MTRHPSKDIHPERGAAPDGFRRGLLRASAVSVAAVASLFAGRGLAVAESADGSRGSGDGTAKGERKTDRGDLPDRIRELEAREAIKELRAHYCWYATRADAESYAELFTADCVFEYKRDGERRRFEGRHAISEIITAITPGTVTPVIGNHTIVLDGNEATGTCAARNTIRGDDGTAQDVVGFYHDRFRYEDGRWRFSERRWFTYSPEYEENEIALV